MDLHGLCCLWQRHCICQRSWGQFFWLVQLRGSNWRNLKKGIAGQDADTLTLWFVVSCSIAKRYGVATLVLALNIAYGGAGWGVANKQRGGITAVEGIEGYAVAVAAIVVGIICIGGICGGNSVGSIGSVVAAAVDVVDSSSVGIEGSSSADDIDCYIPVQKFSSPS